ncbi:MAG: GNAT family N-acetyltransferase [Planctomycetales bacterium]
MVFHYVKRYRMEIDLRHREIPEPSLSSGYFFSAWTPHLVDRHADTKYHAFSHEMDTHVFPCLGNRLGCQRLMQEISSRDSFLPEATWLISWQEPGTSQGSIDCATIQGLGLEGGLGAVQNVGVIAAHRRQGLGKALLLKALKGFQTAKMQRAYLEVTAQNTGAVALYRSMGFHLVRTSYKAIEEPIRTDDPAVHQI